jgi:hypothetical protein
MVETLQLRFGQHNDEPKYIRLTRRVPLVEQELPTLPEHLSSPPVFSGARVTRSLVVCVTFCKSLFVLYL